MEWRRCSLGEGERRPLLAGRARSGSVVLPRRGSVVLHRRGSAPARRRTDSLTIYAGSDAGEDVTSTSYGPVLTDAKHRGDQRALLGWLLAVVSGVLFTANNFFVKQLEMDAAEVLLVRSALQATVLGLTFSSSGGSLAPGPGARLPVALQGLCSGARVLLQLACLAHLPLGDALTLIFTEPLWTLLLARVVLGTRIGPWKVACCAVLLVGMLLCIQPPVIFGPGGGRPANSTGTSYYLGAGLALGSGITGAAANVIIAKCPEVSSSLMVFYSGVGGVLLSLAAGAADPGNRILWAAGSIPWEEWLVLGLLGAMGGIGYWSLTRSLQLVPPTTVAVLRAMEIVLAYIMQALVMGVVPGPLALSGSSLVMLSVMGFSLEDALLALCRPPALPLTGCCLGEDGLADQTVGFLGGADGV